jgi:hypothetical protein
VCKSKVPKDQQLDFQVSKSHCLPCLVLKYVVTTFSMAL